MLGAALLGAGLTDEAITELQRAVGFARNDAGIIGNLAQAYAAAGRHADAEQHFRKASRIAPGNFQYSQGIAIALARQGRSADAILLLQRLTARFPEPASPWYNLGNLYREQQQWIDAEHCYREALQRKPDHYDAHNNLGSVLHSQLRFAEAEIAYRSCIAINPHSIAAHLNLVSVLIDDGRFANAESACRQLISFAPDLPEARRFLAATLSHQGKTAAALPEFAHAAALAPDNPVALRSYGGALAEAGHLHAALRALHTAARLEPDADSLRQLQSMLFLAHGFFSEGWAAYRRRPAFLRFAEKLGPSTLSQSLPTDLDGKHVAVLREQGLGDELFFLRYLPALKSRGAKITALVSDRIAAMIARSNCADAVQVGDNSVAADLRLLCGDLPHALSAVPTSPIEPQPDALSLRDFEFCLRAIFPPLPSTLRIPPLPEAVAEISRRLEAAGPPPYLGVTWRAGTAARDQGDAQWMLSKELPLPLLAGCLRGFRGTLLALQRNPAHGELENFSTHCGQPVHDFTDLNNDLEKMLALLSLINDYVGVSNTNMHLRAAVGQPARVLVPNPAEWRWLASGRSSPWFPGFSLYRQSLDGDWNGALRELVVDLNQ